VRSVWRGEIVAWPMEERPAVIRICCSSRLYERPGARRGRWRAAAELSVVQTLRGRLNQA
jgi:hypothetical protein